MINYFLASTTVEVFSGEISTPYKPESVIYDKYTGNYLASSWYALDNNIYEIDAQTFEVNRFLFLF